MRLIDKPAKIVGPSVESRGGEEIHAVVTPAKFAGKVGYGHGLDDGDAGAGQLAQLAGRRLPCPFAGERPDVHLINDLPRHVHARPPCI